jgi:uncharacterized protein YkwD
LTNSSVLAVRLLLPMLRILLASLILVLPATAPASGFEFGKLFKRKQLDAREVSVDAGEAIRILSDYRRKHGLGAVKLDPKLTRIAADHALRMAKSNKVAHVLIGEGSFARRLRVGGYEASIASENIGAGYDSLEEAFAGWRKSRGHNKNLLTPDVTVIGIARADAPGSKYGTYWSLVLAHPYEPPVGGPSAGPPVMFGQ